MHKIYSRPRLKIPKISLVNNSNGNSYYNKYQKKNKYIDEKKKIKKRKIIQIVFILIIAFSVVKIAVDAIYPIFDTLCENKAKSIATIISNEEVTEVMKEYTYEDLYWIEKDKNNNIVMIKSNIITINDIISKIAVRIQEKLNQKKEENIEIALGSFTGMKLLTGRGPGVKISIVPIGNIETNLKSEFKAEGINQTIHRVYLDIKCDVNILTPFRNIEKEINNQVLLSENIIVGHIPEAYYNIIRNQK